MSPGTPQFLSRGSDVVGRFPPPGILLYLLYFTVFYSISRTRGVFQDPQNDPKTIPKWFQNYSKTIPKLSEQYSKIIPKRSRNDPNMSPKCISASAHPPAPWQTQCSYSPKRGRPPEPPGSQVLRSPRERGVFVFFFSVLQHFLTPRSGFRRPGSGRGPGSGFSGSGGEMARRNRPSYSWVKNRRFCHPASKYRKIP